MLLDIILLILLIGCLGGFGWGWGAGSLTFGSPLGMILVVVIILLLAGLFVPHYWGPYPAVR
jgi:hypothetical protein